MFHILKWFGTKKKKDTIIINTFGPNQKQRKIVLQSLKKNSINLFHRSFFTKTNTQNMNLHYKNFKKILSKIQY